MIAYILSSFWRWLGAVCLIVILFDSIEHLIVAINPVRKVQVSQNGDSITVEIEGATEADIATALADIEQNRQETNPTD